MMIGGTRIERGWNGSVTDIPGYLLQNDRLIVTNAPILSSNNGNITPAPQPDVALCTGTDLYRMVAAVGSGSQSHQSTYYSIPHGEPATAGQLPASLEMTQEERVSAYPPQQQRSACGCQPSTLFPEVLVKIEQKHEAFQVTARHILQSRPKMEAPEKQIPYSVRDNPVQLADPAIEIKLLT